MSDTIFLINLVVTVFLTGLIWVVQVAHYPLFLLVGPREFKAFHTLHIRLISRVVIVPMVVELLTAIWLLFLRPFYVSTALAWIALAALLVIWFSTVVLQVPEHRRLETGYDAAGLKNLIRTNWIRTIGWSLRSAMLLAAFVEGFM